MFDMDLARFERELVRDMARIEEEADHIFRGLTVELFAYVVQETPQYTGHAASNWNYSIGEVNESEDTTMRDSRTAEEVKQNPYQKGSRPAMAVAFSNAGLNDANVHLDIPVYISNSAEGLGDSDYITKMEEGDLPLREANRPGKMMEIAHEMINGKYRVINPQQEMFLRNYRLRELA